MQRKRPERSEPADQRFPGSLGAFASRAIFPAPSTTQTLDASKDTSIPA
jgi:hypothetical protein